MEWTYKNITIRVESDGNFYFSHKGESDCASTLAHAKEKINRLTAEYYFFTEKDLSKMFKKLDTREKDFVNNLMEELKRHEDNAYCSIGFSEDMPFDW